MASQTQVGTRAQKAAPAPKSHIYSGNIMYISPKLTKTEREYLLVMLRFVDGMELEQDRKVPVSVFVKPGTIAKLGLKDHLDRGHLIMFQGREIIEGNTKLPGDNTPVSQVAGFNDEFGSDGLEIVLRKPTAVDLGPTSTPRTPGLAARWTDILKRLGF